MKRFNAQKGSLGPTALGMTLVLLFVSALAANSAGAEQASRLKGELDAKGLRDVVAREKGKVVLVNFWATWCVPCREEFPDIVRLEQDYRTKGLAVIGVNTDLGKESAAVEKFLTTHNPSFANYRKKLGGEDQDFIDAVDTRWGGELPFSVIYARDGSKAAVLSGKQTRASLEKEISKLLK